MSVYYITNGELYHHGVKGMKWGRRKARLENKAARRYGRAARKLGAAQYERDMGADAYRKHDANAKVLDKAAKKYERQGSIFKAEASRRAAAALRARGENVKRQRDEAAARLEKRADKLNQKANSYATKKRVDLGKQRLDAILSENKKKGYDSQKLIEDSYNERETRQRIGDDNYERLERLRGNS